MLSTATFAKEAGGTTVQLVWTAHHATEEEQRTFDASHESMRQGWTGPLTNWRPTSRGTVLPKLGIYPRLLVGSRLVKWQVWGLETSEALSAYPR
jgi:hypothetical protein